MFRMNSTSDESMLQKTRHLGNDEIHIVVLDEDGGISGIPGTILEQFEKRLSTFSTLPEDSQLYYIENISSDINNYQNAINQIKRFDNGLSDSLQSEFDKLIDRMVE